MRRRILLPAICWVVKAEGKIGFSVVLSTLLSCGPYIKPHLTIASSDDYCMFLLQNEKETNNGIVLICMAVKCLIPLSFHFHNIQIK